MLAIGVFCTLIKEKYADEVRACHDTWVKTAKQLGVRVYFFGGYFKSDEFPEVISLDGCSEDYHSATSKQFRGLKWLVENCPAKSYMMFGSDTYPNIPNLLSMLSKLDLSMELYIGGDGEYRQVGPKNIYFHSGGSGFILTRSAAEKISSKCEEILSSWGDITRSFGVSYLLDACDVNMAYFCNLSGIIPIIQPHFHGCNYLGKAGTMQCCTDVIPDKICSCHYMTPEDMRTYYALIK